MYPEKSGSNEFFLLVSEPKLAGSSGPQIRERISKLFFLFLNQNICCRYSKELSQ